MMRKRNVVLMLALALILTVGLVQEVDALTGPEILEKLDDTMRAENQYTEQEMVLVSEGGSERTRDMAMWSRVINDKEEMLVRFLSPADVEGTGLLLEDDDMWLYLPDLGSTRRIAGSAREGDFMGSDFTYEDMEALGTVGFSQDFSAELLAEVEFDEREAYHLELTPYEEDETAYSGLELKVDGEYWLPLEIDYFEENEPVKTLTTHDHEIIDGRWTAGRMEMSNHKDGTKTIMTVREVDYTSEIDPNVFTERNLERGY